MREDILRQRYYQKDPDGNPMEDWHGLCERVAHTLAETENEKRDFYDVMFNRLFLPNSPTLMNAGKKMSYSACFVLPTADSMEEIFDAVKQTALIHKAGGGTGFDFSKLRPAGDMVSTTKGTASGPCSFIRVFDTATDVTKQGGTRRGANMGVLRCDHPDIMEFITMKGVEDYLVNFNISVAITDAFMEALERDKEIPLVFKGKTYKVVKARQIWDAIIEGAWTNGEPGVIFIDELNRHNPTPHIGKFEATNPCGEQPLLPYEACTLGSANLVQHVDVKLKWDLLEKTVRTGVRMLNRIIDVQMYPLPEIEKMHKANRKIGLGVMGWADLLLLLNIRYDSEDAPSLAKEVMKFVTDISVDESKKLAEEKGVFPNWEGSVWQEKGIPMRNATTTTIAPTGSLSIIAECSSGIEPVFAWETIQKRPVGEHRVVHPLYRQVKENNPDEPLPPCFVTAGDIPSEWHVKMQAAFQESTHNAVSKTVNLPNTATTKDVDKIFKTAYDLGCKGITVYRDGSRNEQVISASKKEERKQENTQKEELRIIEEAKRIRIKTSEGNVHIIITHRAGTPLEVFIHSPVESRYAEIYEAFARVFSVALRYNVPLKNLLDQLEKANTKFGSIISPVYAVLRAFRLIGMNGYGKCPDCGGSLIPQEGCLNCLSCGYSKC